MFNYHALGVGEGDGEGGDGDGELCLVRMKSGETLMEVRRDSDVQIDLRNWV